MTAENPETEANITPDPDTISRFVRTQEVDLASLLPYEKATRIKLEERQETTRSNLATLLIKMLAGTLIGSFSLIITLVLMAGIVSEQKKETLKESSALVKDLITFILTAQTGLIGTALGFYFGSRGSNSD